MAATTAVYLFRNCHWWGVSGGDVVTNEFVVYLSGLPDIAAFLVLPKDDRQAEFYPELQGVRDIRYPFFSLGLRGIIPTYLLRTMWCCLFFKRPGTFHREIFFASSHFLPDVAPAFLHSLFLKKAIRVAPIFHLVEDSGRKNSLQNTLSIFQEKVGLWLIKTFFHKILVINSQVEQRLKQLGFHQEILRVDVPVKNWNSFMPLAAERDIDLLFCGRLVTQKGVYDFLNVVKFLQLHLPLLRAVMIGSGFEFQNIQTIISAQNLPVQLTGFIPEEQKYQYFQRARVFLFPSVEEGWGIVINEALAAGCEVVTWNLPIFEEIFGELIVQVPRGDGEALQQRTLEILQKISNNPGGFEKRFGQLQSFSTRFEPYKIGRKAGEFVVS
jgi:glycosyltransferase involved in cell wall biosynthesis